MCSLNPYLLIFMWLFLQIYWSQQRRFIFLKSTLGGMFSDLSACSMSSFTVYWHWFQIRAGIWCQMSAWRRNICICLWGQKQDWWRNLCNQNCQTTHWVRFSIQIYIWSVQNCFTQKNPTGQMSKNEFFVRWEVCASWTSQPATQILSATMALG